MDIFAAAREALRTGKPIAARHLNFETLFNGGIFPGGEPDGLDFEEWCRWNRSRQIFEPAWEQMYREAMAEVWDRTEAARARIDRRHGSFVIEMWQNHFDTLRLFS